MVTYSYGFCSNVFIVHIQLYFLFYSKKWESKNGNQIIRSRTKPTAGATVVVSSSFNIQIINQLLNDSIKEEEELPFDLVLSMDHTTKRGNKGIACDMRGH